MSNNTRIDDRVPRSDRLEYSSGDAAHFEQLMNFPGSGFDASTHQDESPDAPAPQASDYTESDLREFRKLMSFSSGYRGARTETAAGVALNVDYTDSDNRVFERLMAFDQGARTVIPTDPPAAELQTLNPVEYTRQDLEAFRRLSLDEEDTGQRHAGRPHEFRPSTEAHVGHMRIVEYDKDNARETESGKRANTRIKVRFFD